MSVVAVTNDDELSIIIKPYSLWRGAKKAIFVSVTLILGSVRGGVIKQTRFTATTTTCFTLATICSDRRVFPRRARLFWRLRLKPLSEIQKSLLSALSTGNGDEIKLPQGNVERTVVHWKRHDGAKPAICVGRGVHMLCSPHEIKRIHYRRRTLPASIRCSCSKLNRRQLAYLLVFSPFEYQG